MIIDCRPTDTTKHTDRFYLVADTATDTYPNDTAISIIEIDAHEYCVLADPRSFDDDEYDSVFNNICNRVGRGLAYDWFFDRYKVYTHQEMQKRLFK